MNTHVSSPVYRQIKMPTDITYTERVCTTRFLIDCNLISSNYSIEIKFVVPPSGQFDVTDTKTPVDLAYPYDFEFMVYMVIEVELSAHLGGRISLFIIDIDVNYL